MFNPKNKVCPSLSALKDICSLRRQAGLEVVLTSGCWDILHPGHLNYLWRASQRGYLVVGVNSDRSVRVLKGPSRPVQPEETQRLVNEAAEKTS